MAQTAILEAASETQSAIGRRWGRARRMARNQAILAQGLFIRLRRLTARSAGVDAAGMGVPAAEPRGFEVSQVSKARPGAPKFIVRFKKCEATVAIGARTLF